MASTSLAPSPRVNFLTGVIITAAMKVHSLLGPGLLESAYEACLVHELRKQGLEVRNQVVLPVVYDGTTIDLGYRLDLLVEDTVIIELKCTEGFHPIHRAAFVVLEVERQERRPSHQFPRHTPS